MPDQIKRKRPTKDGNNIAKKQQKRDPRGYPRKPPLNGLPGDYNLPQKLRVDLNVLNGFLTVPAKHWSNIQEVLKSYFSETTATLKNGNEFHNLLISTLNTIKEDKGPSVLGEYASRMHTYYNVHLIKEEVRQLYDAKLLIVNLDKEKQRAILAGQRTGAILSRKGAEELAKEIEQDVEQDNEEHQNNQDKQETSNNDVMRIVDGDYNPSVEEIESTMDEEEEEEEKRECIILDNGYPALATTKAIDIGPAPKDMPNDENSRLAKEFHKYKEAVVKQGLNNILTYESNTHEILALTHILLLKQTHVDLQLGTMCEVVLNEIYNDFKDKFDVEYDNQEFRSELKNINKSLKRAGFKRDEIVEDLHDKMMTYKLGSFEYCVLRCLQNIVEEFPDQPLQDIKEHDLIHNIIDPVLRSFLSSSTCRLRWPEVNADVRKYRTTRTQRPDAMISEVKGVQYSKCVAYGEAKAANMDNHGKGVDLIRLAVFGKDCIDAYKLNHVITFQIAGEAVTFFVESLQPETTYTCIELAQIGFPRAISDVKTFIDDVSSYYTIYKAFRSIQQSLDEDYWQDNHRETLDTPQYTHAIDKTKSNGRLCFVHYGR